MNRLIPDATVPLYRTVLAQLRADIRSGALPVGAALPSDRSLCERFGVSRVTVRRALDELTQEGLIDRSAGRATRITAPRLVHAIAAFEDPFSPLRLVRETEVTLLSFRWRVMDGPVVRSLQGEDGEPVLCIERLRNQNGEPVFHTTAYLPARIGALVDRKALDGRALQDVLAAAGCVPATTERHMSAAPCPRTLASLLGLRPGAPCFRIERLSRDTDGRPLHLLIGHWRWDRFSMRLASDALSRDAVLTINEASAALPDLAEAEA